MIKTISKNKTSSRGAHLLFAIVAGVVAGSACSAFPVYAAQGASMQMQAQGVNRIKSNYGFDETVERIKADIATKGIKFFDEIDQSKLGEGANVTLLPSKLLLFGNPPLGVQFLTANPYAGLDWPVRMLVIQNEAGEIWVAWTDFGYIKKRYALKDRDAALKMATEVSASIASSVTK